MRRRPTIGLTGNIATGKSLVLGLLTTFGACGIDADAVYHSLIAPGSPLLTAIADAFGGDVLDGEGALNRRALGQIVFSDPAALRRLEALTHPAVVAAVRDEAEAAPCPIVVIDAVKLVESGLAQSCDEVWLIITERETQIERLMARNNLSQEDATRRIDAQPPDAERRLSADVVIDNSGTIADTTAQVEAAWANFCRRFGPDSA